MHHQGCAVFDPRPDLTGPDRTGSLQSGLRSVVLVIFGLRSGPGLNQRSGGPKMTVARSCHVAWPTVPNFYPSSD